MLLEDMDICPVLQLDTYGGSLKDIHRFHHLPLIYQKLTDYPSQTTAAKIISNKGPIE